MHIVEYLKDKGRLNELSLKTGLSYNFLYQIKKGLRKVPIEHCTKIEIATDGAVTRKDLRPHDWREIWIELAEKEAAENSGSLKD